jgi:hypothetical protein
MPGIDPVLTQFYNICPAAASQYLTVSGDALAGSSVFLNMGDTIQSGTADAAEYLKDLSAYITDEETLLATLNSMAASAGGAGTWISSEIAYLHDAIGSEITSLYANGGTISNLPECAAMSGIPVSIAPPGCSGPGISNAIASAANTQNGPGISQAGVGNSAGGFDIEQAGNSNTAWGSWLDAMGDFNLQAGAYLLAIGSYNIENGAHDVANGTSNTISGSYDIALGNNDTIIGNSAQVFGSGLSASASQTVFGTASNFTVINADGTWSTVVNGSATSSGAGAAGNASLMASESAAMGSAFQTAQTNYLNLVSQYAALGYSQVLSSISADITSGNFGISNFVSSTAPAGSVSLVTASGLTADDAAAVSSLAGSVWGTCTSAGIIATLSGIAGRDAPNTILGADARAALALISAGADPKYALSLLKYDATSSFMTSSLTRTDSVSAQDAANINIANAEFNAHDWSGLSASLAILATSSDPVVANIGSAELAIAADAGIANTGAGVSGALYADYEQGKPIPSDTIATMEGQLSAATGSVMSWTGSNFVVLCDLNPLQPLSSPLSSSDLSALETLANLWDAWDASTSTAIMSALSDIVTSDGPNTIYGATAASILTLISAGKDPTHAIYQLRELAGNRNAPLGNQGQGSISSRDGENIILASDGFFSPSDELTIFSTLATSSDKIVAAVASAELTIYKAGDTNMHNAEQFLLDYTQGGSLDSTRESGLLTQLNAATGSNFTILPGFEGK